MDLWESEALARRLAGPHESLTVDRSSSAEVDALSSELLPDWCEDWAVDLVAQDHEPPGRTIA